MASVRWKGKALARAEVKTLTLGGTWTAGDTITLSIPDTTGKSIVLTVGSTVTTTQIATELAAAWNSATSSLGTGYSATERGPNIPEFDEITAAASSSTVVFTHDTKGVPFSLAVSRTTASSGSVSLAATTAATGPNFWDNPNNWSGGAVPVSGANEVQTITVDATGGTFTVTFSGQTTGAQAYNVAAASLQSALEGLSTIGSGNITVTGGPGAAGGGTPYTLTFTGTLGYQNVAAVTTNAGSLTGGAGTAAVATTTAGATGDEVYIDNSDVSILYALDQSSVILGRLQIDRSYTGFIGLPEINEDGEEYLEYREQYLKIGVVGSTPTTPTLFLGRGEGDGSGRIKLNTGSYQTTGVVEGSGTPEEQDLPAILWKGTHASNAWTVAGDASFGVAAYGGETATITTLTAEGQAETVVGSGTTLSTVALRGRSSARIQCAVGTSLTCLNGATATLEGTGAVAQLTARDESRVTYNTSGTLGGNTVLSGSAVLDFDQDPRAKTVTNPIDVYGQAQVIDSQKVVASLVVDFNETAPGDLNWGSNVRLTRGTVA